MILETCLDSVFQPRVNISMATFAKSNQVQTVITAAILQLNNVMPHSGSVAAGRAGTSEPVITILVRIEFISHLKLPFTVNKKNFSGHQFQKLNSANAGLYHRKCIPEIPKSRIHSAPEYLSHALFFRINEFPFFSRTSDVLPRSILIRMILSFFLANPQDTPPAFIPCLTL